MRIWVIGGGVGGGCFFFFFNDTATTEIYTLSLHDALPICNLQQQLLYPDSDAAINQSNLSQILETVNLAHLLTSPQESPLSSSKNLSARLTQSIPTTLSLGEQQRLAFARVLLNSPTYLILDEATSALDLDHETLLYRSEEHTSELQSLTNLVCRLLLEKKKKKQI